MSETRCYSAFGLELTADRPIPGLVRLRRPGNASVRIWFDAIAPRSTCGTHGNAWYSSSFIEWGRPAVSVWKVAGGAYFRWQYSDGTEFVVDRTGGNVWASWPDSSTPEDTATYLLGPVLGFVLRLRGVTCLHASAVAAGDSAIAFVGPASAGKSTTAAAFSRLGYRVLADDIVALAEHQDTPHVQPAFPQVRLWPESVALLYGSAEALPPLTPNWNKRFLDLTVHDSRFERHPLPLGAVYLLSERTVDAATPVVTPVAARDALLALVANTYVNYLEDADTRGREFRSLARVVGTVPVRKATPPADPERLPQFCRRIMDDVQHR